MNQINQMPRNQMSGCRRQTEPCPCSRDTSYDNMTQTQLLNHINEISFTVNDILLYLDTHPYDRDALAYSRSMVTMRNSAKKTYAKRFGPLTVDCTADIDSNSWEWILQPWPWEPMPKGGCR